MSKINVTAPAADFRLDLEHSQTFRTTGPIMGHPVANLSQFGMLPDEFRESAAQAEYVVYYYETPIVWRLADGTWRAPHLKINGRTTAARNKMVAALELFTDKIDAS